VAEKLTIAKLYELMDWAKEHRCEEPVRLTPQQQHEIHQALTVRERYYTTAPAWRLKLICMLRGHRFGPWHMTWEAMHTHDDQQWVERICRRCGREEQRDV
jgi:hypothetical protein